MERLCFSIGFFACLATPAAAQIVATPRNQPATAAEARSTDTRSTSAPSADAGKLAAVVGQALQFLGKAENYTLRVESRWKASGDAPGQEGQSNYRLIARGPQHRIEVQSAAAETPQLVCVNDGQQVTTLLPAQSLYSQHPVGSPQASLESNQMLAQSLAGSAIDILLQPNVGQFVQSQASAVKYHGLTELVGRGSPDPARAATAGLKIKCHHFALDWAGADVELWLAAEGDPLLMQFVRTACVPTSESECYEMVHTARFQWQLNTKLAGDTFAVSLSKEARRVNDIYDALSGEDPTARIGKPLPQIQLSQLDGSTLDVAVPEGKRGLVLIFWATWCTPSVEDMPAVSQFVKTGAEQGFAFYAVNVGEEPGAVRRFTAKSPLTSAIALDPKARASSALRVTELPAAVVVGPDNAVRAILTGTAKEVQAGVAQELRLLLEEPAPTPKTARRPGQTPAAPQ